MVTFLLRQAQDHRDSRDPKDYREYRDFKDYTGALDELRDRPEHSLDLNFG